jgi:hypothetical protein
VIGQSAYKSGDIAGPARDVAAVAAALERRGFTVTRAENLAAIKDLDETVKTFAKTVPTNGTALVYFSGQAASVTIGVGANPMRQDIGLVSLDGGKHPLSSVLAPLVMPQYAPLGPDGRARGLADLHKQGRQCGSRINIVILDDHRGSLGDPTLDRGAIRDYLLPDSLVIFPADNSALAERFVAELSSNR